MVGFTLLAEGARHAFARLTSQRGAGPWVALAATPLLTVMVLDGTRRFVPGAMGSGIPQVMRALDDDPPPQRLSRRRGITHSSLVIAGAGHARPAGRA